jgi:hypothetical protein
VQARNVGGVQLLAILLDPVEVVHVAAYVGLVQLRNGAPQGGTQDAHRAEVDGPIIHQTHVGQDGLIHRAAPLADVATVILVVARDPDHLFESVGQPADEILEGLQHPEGQDVTSEQ